MNPIPDEHTRSERAAPQRDFFDVYRVAIDDLHHTKDLAQKIDSLYVTIVTLLLTADAYEIATTRFDSWTSTFATVGVALIGITVTGRWRKGADNLFNITTNRYKWLRDAEDTLKHPEMKEIGANIFTQEYDDVYRPQIKGAEPKNAASDPPSSIKEEPGYSKFYSRTVFLQSLCYFIFVAIPVILGVVTYLNLNSSLIQTVERVVLGR